MVLRSWLITALLALCAALAACSGDNTGDSRRSSSGTVVIGLLSEPTTLNPIAATSARERHIIDLLFLKLMKEEADFVTFSPSLAESWSFSEDGLDVTFTLRDGVVWHDGVPVTAHDVKFTYDLQTNPDAAWSGRHIKDRIESVEVIDDRRVVFHFAERYPYQLMDINDGPILPKHLLEAVSPSEMRTSEFGRAPVGSGPYRMTDWSPSQSIRLVVNEAYYDPGLPRLAEVVFRVVADETAMMTALKAGDIDGVSFLTPEATADPAFEDGRLRAYKYAGRQMTFIAWNTTRAPFDDAVLRRALARGIDANAIIETAWNGLAGPSTSPMHPILWAFDETVQPIPFDPTAARTALAELGWIDSDGDGVVDRDGQPLTFEILANQGAQQRIDACTIVQAQMKAIGVDVKIRVLEWNAFIQSAVVKGEFDACLFAYNVETRADLTNFWKTGATFNLSRYSNAEVDALIDQARAAADRGAARPLWARAQHIIYNDQPHYFLALPFELMGVNSRYCGVAPTAQSPFVNLPEWYVGEDCD